MQERNTKILRLSGFGLGVVSLERRHFFTGTKELRVGKLNSAARILARFTKG